MDALTLRKPLRPICLLSAGSAGFVGVSVTVLTLSDTLEEGVVDCSVTELGLLPFSAEFRVFPSSLVFSIVEDVTVVGCSISEVSPPTSLAATLLTNKADVTIPIETATQCFFTLRNFFIKI